MFYRGLFQSDVGKRRGQCRGTGRLRRVLSIGL